jgi:hypothetical protein
MAKKKMTMTFMEWIELPIVPVKQKREREERKTLAQWNREAAKFIRENGGSAGDTPMWPRRMPTKQEAGL